jgi:hypothetical protein
MNVVPDELVDIDAVADELYALPPAEFIAARGAREKQAKASGDKALAGAIHQLAKPTTTAWLANQLVREHPDEIESFLELGVVLREATATLAGDQLRALDKQKRQASHALMAQVRALATAAGHKVTEAAAQGVEETLHAVLSDPGAADQFRAGWLTGSLHATGFPSAASGRRAQPAPPPPSARHTKNARAIPAPAYVRPMAASQARAEMDEQLARTALAEAERARDKARGLADRAETAARGAAALVGRLSANLDKAQIEARLKEVEHARAQAEVERAETGAREAARRLEDATQARLGIDVYAVSDPAAPGT